jgi:hypothetical protein
MSEEYSYYVIDLFGNKHYIAEHIFAKDPRPWRGFDVDMSGSGSVPRGVPDEWQRYKDEIAADDATSIAVEDFYDNIVLGYESTQEDAARDNRLKDRLKAANLLPPLSYPIHDRFKVDKIQFVGMDAPENKAKWLDYLMRTNAALGMKLRGDLHVVVIKAQALTSLGLDPADYIRTLQAYWLSDFGKDALPKNAIIVALGVDDAGKSVYWARAKTGMQKGNNEMFDYIANRFITDPLVSFDPDVILGKTTASVRKNGNKYDVNFTLGGGVLTQAIMVDVPFKRACMKCTDKDEQDQVGYIDLQDLIPISGWAIFWAIVIMFLISLLLGGVFIAGYSFLTGAMAFEAFRTIRSTKYDNVYSSY